MSSRTKSQNCGLCSVVPTDIEEGARVEVDRNKYQIHIPLPPKIDPTVTMMQVSFDITN